MKSIIALVGGIAIGESRHDPSARVEHLVGSLIHVGLIREHLLKAAPKRYPRPVFRAAQIQLRRAFLAGEDIDSFLCEARIGQLGQRAEV